MYVGSLVFIKNLRIGELYGRTLQQRIRALHRDWRQKQFDGYQGRRCKDVGRKTDVLVSATADYDIGDVVARDNLIRVLILADDDFNKNKCLNYDIVISDMSDLDLPNLYPIDNLDELGENLISILKSLL